MPKKTLDCISLRNRWLPTINALIQLCERGDPQEPALVPLRDLARKFGDISTEYSMPEQYFVHLIAFTTTISTEKEDYQTVFSHFIRTIVSATLTHTTNHYTIPARIEGQLEKTARFNPSLGLLGIKLKPLLKTAQAALALGTSDPGASVISREDAAEIAAAGGSSAPRSDTAETAGDGIESSSAQPLPDSAASVNPPEAERVISELPGEHARLLQHPPRKAEAEPTNEARGCKCTML